MVVKNLEFFDKDGYNLNLNWNDIRGIWEGNIFFPRVSVGLYENTTIYVVECDTSDSDYMGDPYTYPTGEGNIIFQWDLSNQFVDEFFMMNHSTPGLPVHHQLPEFTQTHIHRVPDAIHPSHPLSSPSPPAFNLAQHQGLFQ